MNKTISENMYINFIKYWSKYLQILIISILISTLISFLIQNKYSSSALLIPSAISESSSPQLSGLSSIAGLSGLDIGGSGNEKSIEAIHRIKSYDFYVNYFVKNIEYKNLVAAKSWSLNKNVIEYDENIFSIKNNEWVKKNGVSLEPSLQEGYKTYKKILIVNQDKGTKYVNLSVRHVSPQIANDWIELIVRNINKSMSEVDKKNAKDSIDFLTNTLYNTNINSLKISINKLLENQLRKLMLASNEEVYVFRYIEKPIIAEEKSYPNRLLIVLLGLLIGLVILIIHNFAYSLHQTFEDQK